MSLKWSFSEEQNSLTQWLHHFVITCIMWLAVDDNVWDNFFPSAPQSIMLQGNNRQEGKLALNTKATFLTHHHPHHINLTVSKISKQMFWSIMWHPNWVSYKDQLLLIVQNRFFYGNFWSWVILPFLLAPCKLNQYNSIIYWISTGWYIMWKN